MYIPATEAERRAMMAKIGIKELDELFASIPAEVRLETPLAISGPMGEIELAQHMGELARKNTSADDAVCFLGGGCYDHFIPAVVDTIAARSEFYTSYTPYQAEVSQGTLQVAFEFQTMVCELTGLDVSNASLYEGATAMVEAAHLALAATGRKKIVLAGVIHPEYVATLRTYLAHEQAQIVCVGGGDGVVDLDLLARNVDEDTAAIIVQSPNFLGLIEPVEKIAHASQSRGGLTIQVFDPVSLGLLKRPGEMGVDIAVGEGQGLGNPMSFGGPFLGLFACRKEHVRRIPGRVVGQTVDRRGNPCFVLTLQTREQHIRREKATSNICTNQGLLALRACVHLSLLGPQGMRELAESCWHRAHYAAKVLGELPGCRLKFASPFFKEFVVELPSPSSKYLEALVAKGYHAGVALGRWYPELENCVLIAVTEKRTRRQIDGLADAWRSVLA